MMTKLTDHFTLDPTSETRLAMVNPLLANKIRDLAAAMLPIEIRVTQGLRSWTQQQKLYAQGRTTPGEVVTNAPPGHSWHQFGLAVDVVPDDASIAGFQCDWNVKHPVWAQLIKAGEGLGLVAGAEFRSFPDYPHFQLTGKLPTSPNDEARQTFIAAGMKEVWKEAGLFDMENGKAVSELERYG